MQAVGDMGADLTLHVMSTSPGLRHLVSLPRIPGGGITTQCSSLAAESSSTLFGAVKAYMLYPTHHGGTHSCSSGV